MTHRSGDPIALDVVDIARTFEQRVRDTAPDDLALALRLLERLPPTRWTLEWYLPWWLGQSLGLESSVTREFVLANVLGLGSIRLRDDLADAEVAPDDVPGSRRLATTLYGLALEPYRTWFDPKSPFWRHLEMRMAAWNAADDDPGRYDLAARAAPLHVSAVAIHLLAGRMDAYPALESCLDQALEALVLYDHVADWEADLDGGRWNAFVAAVSPGPQLPDARDRHRAATYVAMLATDAVATYFARIDARLSAAAERAESLDPGVAPLVEHLHTFAAGVRDQGSAISERYRALGEETAKRLFPAPSDARS